MKPRMKKAALMFPVILPIVFSILFFWLLPPKFTVVLYTDNIQGEGICQTYTCPPRSFSPFYTAKFYFGSELHKATVQGYHYDVDTLQLIISDVSEAEILGVDIRVFGIPVKHISSEQIVPEGEFEGPTATIHSETGRFHITVKDPDVGTMISFTMRMIPVWVWAVYWALMLALTLLLSVCASWLVERFPALKQVLWHISAIIVTLVAGMFFCYSLPFAMFDTFALNWLFLFALSLFLNGLTLPWLGTVLTMVFTTVWYMANYFVIIFRNKPIMPADLKAARTAAEVAGGYSFTPSWQMILGILLVLVYAAAVIRVCKSGKAPEKRPVKKQLLRRGCAVVTAVVMAVVGLHSSTFQSLNSFAWDAVLLKSFHQEGMVLTYLKSALHAGVSKPEGYSRELVSDYLAEYQGKAQQAEGTQPTNIIMVMNEAFSDLRTVGLDDKINVMPFIDSLDENTAKGSLYVSVFGGGTCNTEFEGLTGNTLAFLGIGAYPYTENVTAPLFSLASYFRDRGYLTASFHANEPQNWNRNMVYPNLGFGTFYSIHDFSTALGNIPYLHDHPADIADYAFINKIDSENKDMPRFLFDVTMQNHSGYERWIDVEEAESVIENAPDLYFDTRVYLSLVKASDDAVKQLVETYQDSDEPTMIIFFGDHQPGLPSVAQNEFYTEVSSYLDWYKSKFFIWTNYETEALHDAEVSANYLPWLVLERGNFPLPPYVQMLAELHEKYPVISSMGVIDADGNTYSGVAEVANDPLIQKYRYVQYANLFDELDDAWFETVQ